MSYTGKNGGVVYRIPHVNHDVIIATCENSNPQQLAAMLNFAVEHGYVGDDVPDESLGEAEALPLGGLAAIRAAAAKAERRRAVKLAVRLAERDCNCGAPKTMKKNGQDRECTLCNKAYYKARGEVLMRLTGCTRVSYAEKAATREQTLIANTAGRAATKLRRDNKLGLHGN